MKIVYSAGNVITNGFVKATAWGLPVLLVVDKEKKGLNPEV